MYRPRVENPSATTPTKESKVRQLMRTRHPDFGSEGEIGQLEREAAGIKNDTQKLIDFLDAAVISGRIAFEYTVRSAYRDAQSQHEDYDLSSFGLQCRVLKKVRELDWDTKSTQDIADVMDAMIKDPKESVPLSAEGLLKRQQQAEAQRKAGEAQKTIDYINAMIQNITKGKPQFPRWSPQHGKVVNTDSAMLQNLTVPELEAMDREVAALRQRRFDMDKDQQREALHEVANANRIQYGPKGEIVRLGFDNRVHADSLGEIHNPNSGPKRAYAADPTASPIQGHRTASSTDPFISSATGRELTRREAIALSKTNLAEFARLSKLDKLRLNRILAQ